MNVLVACEESQEVCKAFRAKGHQAFSCDIIDCSGGHPEWHIKDDVLNIINGYVRFETCDGEIHHNVYYGTWDMIIAFPPCTYLTVSGNRWFDVEKYGELAIQRAKLRENGAAFFMEFVNAKCDKVAIENPIGVMSTRYRKPDQILQPFEFGHPYTKQTCLWLKGLRPLIPTQIIQKPKEGWINQSFTPDGRYGGFNTKFRTARERSKTFTGIAKAMAEQWG